MTWIASAILAVFCCAAALPDPVPFKPLESGVQSDIERPRETVARTAAEWKALCADHAGGRACTQADLTKSTVIGVFLGTRPSTGYHVEIARIDREGDGLVVTWREKKPGANEMAAQMITMPYMLVTIDRFTGPIRFVRAH